MIRIEISSSTVDEKRGTSSKSGKPYLIREQGAWAFILDDQGKPAKYPVACKLQLDEAQQAYAPGMYTFDGRSVVVGDFGRLSLANVQLIAAK